MQQNYQSHIAEGNTLWILCWNQLNHVTAWQETELASRMHSLVSPKLHELLGDKFANRISNN